MQIIRVDEMPAVKDRAAAWFAEKWKDHETEYQNSITQSLNRNIMLPKWYIMLEGGQIQMIRQCRRNSDRRSVRYMWKICTGAEASRVHC